ncbi:condensation domain-containing protein [Paenibacillus sp. 481]|uniref:condensation domain-containing protein n=1 Tax=Paenibacillus sp. 481 TaxID=2835869 RepID=UPI001E307BDE|nr:condensation domain-containing protein [Paenibacillus sp. 481]UHA73335.1 AMP-binding protein [Paenibacillus sp. 481]
MTIQSQLEQYIKSVHPIKDVRVEMHIQHVSADVPSRPDASAILNQQQHFQYTNYRSSPRRSAQHGVKEARLIGPPLVWADNEPRTLIDAFSRTLQKDGHKKLHFSLKDGTDSSLSYTELDQQAARILHGLIQLGLKPGDAVLIQVERIDYFISLFWACIFGGFLPAPLKLALNQQPNHAERKKVEQVWEFLNRPLIVTDCKLEDVATEQTNGEQRIVGAEVLLGQRAADHRHTANPEDGALFLFTSGTTGMPKCVRYNHTHVLANIFGIQRCLELTQHEVTLNWMPLYHAGGLLTNHVLGVVLGCEQVLRPVEHFLTTPCSWLQDIEAYRVTFTWAPNFAFAQINQLSAEIESSSWDLSSVRTILNVGQPISVRTAKTFLQTLSSSGLSSKCIVPAYGMTEFSGSLCFNREFDAHEESGVQHIWQSSLNDELRFAGPDDSSEAVAFAEIGRVMPGVDLRIVDDMDKALPEACVGKVQLKGDTIIDGYYNHEAATSAAFTEDGWFETGDLGFVYDGRLTLTGRAKDVLIMNAKNVYNFEVESVMSQAYGIDPNFAAAAGISGGEDGNDRLLLFFSPLDDDIMLTLLLIQELRGLVSRQFGVNPCYIVPVSKANFPRTPTGKIQRLQLVHNLLDGQYDTILATVDDLLRNRFQRDELFAHAAVASTVESQALLSETIHGAEVVATEMKHQEIVVVYYSSECDDLSDAALYIKIRDYLSTQHENYGHIEVCRRHSISEHMEEDYEEELRFLTNSFEKLLKRPVITRNHDFFQLGGDSLKMTKLLTMLISNYNIMVTPHQFFKQPTIQGLLQEMILAKQNSSSSHIPTHSRDQSRMPLTIKQKSQWILHMIEPNSAFYTNTFTLRFQGACDREHLTELMRILIERHEGLRIRFGMQYSEPFQYVEPPYSPYIRHMDLSLMEGERRRDRESELVRQEANHRFDLLQEPCLRLLLLTCGENEHRLVISMHHIMSDGWSVEVFTNELMDLYGKSLQGERPHLTALPVSYSNYVYWQSEREQDHSSSLWAQTDYWRQLLNGPLPTIQVPPDFVRPEVRSYKGDTIDLTVSSSLASLARAKANRSGITLFMLMFAVYAYLIHRFSKQSSVPIGTVMANRTRPELEKLIGFVANTVVLRIEFDDEMTFNDLLEQVKTSAVGAYQHQEVPFEMVLPLLSDRGKAGYTPGFQVMFTYQNEFTHNYQFTDASVRLEIEAGDTAKFDLILHVYEEADTLRLRMEYNTDLYKKETIERLLNFYTTILEGVVEH